MKDLKSEQNPQLSEPYRRPILHLGSGVELVASLQASRMQARPNHEHNVSLDCYIM